MTAVQSIRHSQIRVWMLVCSLAVFLVLALLTRVAGAGAGQPEKQPIAAATIA